MDDDDDDNRNDADWASGSGSAKSKKTPKRKKPVTAAASSRTSSQGKRKRQRAGGYSDESDEAEDDDDDNDDQDEEDDDDFINDLGDDTSDSESDDDIFHDGYDEDLMGDENDRRYLASLTEFKREEILADRQEKRDAILQRLELKKRMKQKERQSSRVTPQRETPSATGLRRSTRKASSDKEKRQSRLREIRENREKQNQLASEKANEGEDAKEESAAKTRQQRRIYDDDDDVDVDDSQRSNLDEDEKTPPLTIEDMRSIQLTRGDILKFVHMPDFESRIVGLFARINIGVSKGKPVYRVTEIVNVVKQEKPYVVDSLLINRTINFRYGLSARVFRIRFVSNQLFDANEVTRWVEEMELRNQRLPTLSQVNELRRRVEELRNHIFNPEEISTIVKSKQQLEQLPKNLSRGKSELLHQLAIAQQKGDLEEVAKLEEKLRLLEESQREKTKVQNSQLSVMDDLNKKNRDKQAAELLRAIPLRNRVSAMAAPDPFTRKETLSRLTPKQAHVLKKEEPKEEKEAKEAKAPGEMDVDSPAASASSSQPSQRPSSSLPDVTDAPDEMNIDIDIDIDIDTSVPKTIPLTVPDGLRVAPTPPPSKKLGVFGSSATTATPGTTPVSGSPSLRTLGLSNYKKQHGLI